MKNRRHFLQTLTSLVVASLCAAAPALAPATPTAAKEVAQVRLAQQYGIGYLPLIVVEQNKLIEKHAKAAGLGDVEVSWTKFAGGNVMNDALLSGSLDFASGGIAPAVTLWAKTRGTKGEVKLVSALDSMPLLLNTRSWRSAALAARAAGSRAAAGAGCWAWRQAGLRGRKPGVGRGGLPE